VVSADLVWLAVLAVIFSVIGAFYYLRLIKLMYFDKPLEQVPFSPSPDVAVIFSVNALAVLLIGLFPSSLMAICRQAMGL
jgi:NADH-quinone oxidoreductase subunit N